MSDLLSTFSEVILANGADVDATDNDCETALMKAAGEGHLQIVEVILYSGLCLIFKG